MIDWDTMLGDFEDDGETFGLFATCIADPDVMPMFSSMHQNAEMCVMLVQGVELARGNMVYATQAKFNGTAACQFGKLRMGNKSNNV